MTGCEWGKIEKGKGEKKRKGTTTNEGKERGRGEERSDEGR